MQSNDPSKPANPTVRLSDFILHNMEAILQAWEDFAATIEPPALTMSDVELRDHAKSMLTTIAEDLTRPQSPFEQSEKSKGRGPKAREPSAAEIHAEARLLSGFSIDQLISEYRALRSSVLQLWSGEIKRGVASDPEDVTRFNESLDQAIAESVARYATLVGQSENMFLAILGHDLRNPLGTVITGATFLMRATDLPSKYVLAATRIFNSGQRMKKLIADLIDFTRSHLGSALPIKPRQCSLSEVCLNVVDELRTSHPERLIDFDADARIDACVDEDRIAQVMSNLIGNALQYGDRGEPITVSMRPEPERVVLTVNNKGTPIAPRQLANVFDPLVRLAGSTSHDHGQETNLGIGLFIAREIVHSHHGSISVDSDPASGTTFTVILPLDPNSPGEAGTPRRGHL